MKLIPYLFTLLFITSFHLLPAQENVNELIEEATELATKANKQLVDRDYETAAENFEKAAKKFQDAGMLAQANAERINAGAAYDNAADKAKEDRKHVNAAKLYGKAAQAYDKAGAVAAAASSRRNKSDSLDEIVVQNALGTGNTTGHIATINVQNNGDLPLIITPQIFFIPSEGKHQSYVGSTPSGVRVGVGQSAEIPVHGYCVDVHTPPVGAASPMPPLDSWIPVATQMPEPMNPPLGENNSEEPVLELTFGIPSVSFFDTLQISEITNSTGFTPFAISTESETPFSVTWPGTVAPLGGTIDLNDDPVAFAPLLVEIVGKVQVATENLQDSGDLRTPFSGDFEKEKEAVIQQTLWRVMGALTGEEYTKEGFTSNIHTQFEEKTGMSVSNLPEEEEEKMNAGVADFWNSFTAVGLEAKVIKAEETVDQFGWFSDDYEDVEKKTDLPKLLRPKYERYAAERAIKNKSHNDACKGEGVDADSDLAKAFERIYDNQTK